jgi:pyridoxamine 5'-phosphate oxidase
MSQRTEEDVAKEAFEATDPVALFRVWFAEAELSEPNDANAMALATVDGAGMPDVRVVLLKDMDEAGFVFYTNLKSAKGEELLSSGKAALNFHWKSLRRQVRVRGLVAQVSDAEADEYFASRPRGSQLGAWASNQSHPMASRETLIGDAAALDKKYEGADVPRPPHWSGFRVTPLTIEFWINREFRLHDRRVFRRSGPDAPWSTTRLYP